MARLLYGLGPDDRTATSSGATVPNAQVTVWDALTGGSRVTDITAAGVGSVSGGVVTTDAYGRVGFYGPDGGVGPLFLEGAGGGPRVRVSPSPVDVAQAADLSGNPSLRATFLRAYTTSVGDGAALVYPVAHGLNTTDVAVTVRDAATGEVVYPTVTVSDADTVTVRFATPPAVGAYTVMVVG